jgi:anti-sigma factor RsiW
MDENTADMTSPYLNCRELVELVTDYLEGTLSPEAQARFEAHASACEGCGAYLEQMEQTIRLTGMLTDEQVPDAAMHTLLEAFRGWKSNRDKPA